MNKHIVRGLLALGGVGALAMGVSGCEGTEGDAKAETKEAAVAAPTTEQAPSTAWLDDILTTAKAAPVAANPYETDGEWLVPSEIQPGKYKAVQTGSFSGYVAVCADLECEIDMDGSDLTGLIDNYTVDGQSYVTVPQGAAKVELSRVNLLPIE